MASFFAANHFSPHNAQISGHTRARSSYCVTAAGPQSNSQSTARPRVRAPQQAVSGAADFGVGSSGGDAEQRRDAEFEAAVGMAVHDAMEAEMITMKDSVAKAVNQAMRDDKLDLTANFNTLVALTGVCIFERGVWAAWDLYFGDTMLSNLTSIAIGLGIMVSIRIFNIPLAEWRQPGE